MKTTPDEAQSKALDALIFADSIYRQADAHRTEMIELVRALDCPLKSVMAAIGMERI